jgi:hypothetical protein
MALTPPSIPPSPSSPSNNALSDIFSDSPPSSPSKTDPSDIPRLRSTHSTAGYRDGITVAKALSLQPGFDEGYSLGAAFGLRIGYILGALEGLWSACTGLCEEKERQRKLLREAREGLRLERVFGKEWWGEDGVWRYEVQGEGEEVTFEEVVGWHPLVKRWEERVKDELERAGVTRGRFEGVEWEKGRMDVGIQNEG